MSKNKQRKRYTRRKKEIIINLLRQRDGEKCKICNKNLNFNQEILSGKDISPNYITIDHIIPLSEGGKNKIDNYQLTHYKCNNYRGFLTEKIYYRFDEKLYKRLILGTKFI